MSAQQYTLADFTLLRCTAIPAHVHNASTAHLVGKTYYSKRRFAHSEYVDFWDASKGDPFTHRSSYANEWSVLHSPAFVIHVRFLETCFAAPCLCPDAERMHSGYVFQETPGASRLETPVEITRCRVCWKSHRADGLPYDEAQQAAAWKAQTAQAETRQAEGVAA